MPQLTLTSRCSILHHSHVLLCLRSLFCCVTSAAVGITASNRWPHQAYQGSSSCVDVRCVCCCDVHTAGPIPSVTLTHSVLQLQCQLVFSSRPLKAWEHQYSTSQHVLQVQEATMVCHPSTAHWEAASSWLLIHLTWCPLRTSTAATRHGARRQPAATAVRNSRCRSLQHMSSSPH